MGMVDADSLLLRDTPLRRADGAAAYNGHFWPLEGDWFWANLELGQRFSSRWNFLVIALEDGTWLSEMAVWKAIQYPTREAALRVSAARLIRTLRAARRWEGQDRLSPEAFRALVAWVFSKVNQPPPPIRELAREIPAPAPASPPAWADLPLFQEASDGQ